MRVPMQLQFRGLEPSDFISNSVWDHVEKLEGFYDRMTSCSVTVSAPHHHKHLGKIYQVKVHIYLPGGEIWASTEGEHNQAHEDVYVCIRDAFQMARRRLEDFIRKQRVMVKSKPNFEKGKVVRLFPNEDCGFISTFDEREIYFHRHAVANGHFDELRIGDRVRFSEELGEKGPQVTSMSPLGKG